MSFVSVAVGAFNQYNQGKLAKEQGAAAGALSDYQAQVEADQAQKLAAMIRRAGRKQQGAANAGYVAAGAKVGEGSAAEVEREIGHEVERDAFQALLEGDRRAAGLRLQGVNARAQGQMAYAAGIANATSTVLSGTNAAMRASGWRTRGPGFSGQQMPAPVEDRSLYGTGWDALLRTNRSTGD